MKENLFFSTRIITIFVVIAFVVSGGVLYAQEAGQTDTDPQIVEPTEEVVEVKGCMDSDATNYDEEATIDDGSCEFEDTDGAESLNLQVQSAPSPKIEICHYNNGKGGSWNVIEINENAWSTHLDHGVGDDLDFKITSPEDAERCEALNNPDNPNDPEDPSDPGSGEPIGDSTLKICKIIIDNQGNIITGSEVDTEFSIDITGPDSFNQTVTFNTELTLDNDLVDDNGNENDAQCYPLEDLKAGTYLYSAEEIDGEGVWGVPLYHDYFQEVPDYISDFYELTVDGSDDDNDEADGVVNLDKGSTRSIVVVNALREVPEPEMCNLTIVSDTDDYVLETADFAKLVSWIHSAWTAVVPGANWIWGDDPVADPVNETVQTFVKKFNWTGENPVATLDIATDNSYVVELNGSEIASDSAENNHALATQDQETGFSIQPGMNELKVTVTNWELANGTIKSNPAGLLYSLSIDGEGESCGEPIPYEPDPEPEPTPENLCLIPSTEGDEDDDDLSGIGEIDLQEILDDLYGFLDKNDDQLQIQKWNCSADELTLDVKFVGEWAGNNAMFGYYTDSDLTTFDPIFRTGNVNAPDNAVALATTTGDIFSVNAGDIDSLGFAIKSWTGSKYNVFATENSLNPSGADKVVAYNPSEDTYLLAFDDLLNSHIDYNDLVVEIKSRCEDVEEPRLPAITKFFLVDADTDNDLVELTEGLVININNPPFSLANFDSVNIRAVAAGDPESVIFKLDTDPNKTENISPWALFGDNGPTDYKPGSIGLGPHTILATPYTADNGGGDVGAAKTVNFEIVDESDPEPTNEKPVITVGSLVLNLTVGDTFTEDATADDAEDGDLTDEIVKTGDTVDTGTPGTYTVYYNVQDKDGAAADQVTRTVNVNSPQITSTSGGSGGGGGSISGGYRRPSGGEVLGATTDLSCGMYLYDYMRQDLPNDYYEVLKLQAFLLVQGYPVPLNGVFGSETDAAVRAFQSDLNERILVPWAAYNLSDGETPTGYVYKTTRYTINNIVCPGSEDFPVLP